MRKIIIAIIAASLAACSYTVEDQEHDLKEMNETLNKKGCEVKYAGSVRVEGEHHKSKVFLTTCESTATATISQGTQQSQGKTSYEESNVLVDTNYGK